MNGPLEDSSLLISERTKVLFTKPNGLKLRTWYRTHIKNCNFVKINPSGRKTVSVELCLGQVDNIWAVTSSTGNPSMTMDNAKQRMRERMVADNKSFASYMEVRKSCWIIEERRGQFFCDCPLGFKGHMCKVTS